MRTTFPTAIDAVYMGIDRQAGEFTDRSTGEVISYGRNHLFAFDSADGTTQTVAVREQDLDQVPEFNISGVQKFAPVALHGEVVLSTGQNARSYFRLLRAEAAKRAANAS